MIPSSIPQWLRSAFIKAAQAAGATASEKELETAYQWLIARWGAAERQCHGIKHVADVLSNVDVLADSTQHANCVRLAAWYHGVVFNWAGDAYSASAGAGEDEDASADLAREQLAAIGVPEAAITRIAELIRAMRTRAQDAEIPDASALRDAHLGTLAVDPQRYKKYRESVRAEFSHIADGAFIRARLAVIDRLLDRRHIFQSPLAAQWETSARENLKAEARQLRKLLAEHAPSEHAPSESPADASRSGEGAVTPKETAGEHGADAHQPAVSAASAARVAGAANGASATSADESDRQSTTSLEITGETAADVVAGRATSDKTSGEPTYSSHYPDPDDTYEDVDPNMVIGSHEDDHHHDVDSHDHIVRDPASAASADRQIEIDDEPDVGEDDEIIQPEAEESSLATDPIGPHKDEAHGEDADARHRIVAPSAENPQDPASADDDSAEISSLERSVQAEEDLRADDHALRRQVVDPPHSDAHAIASATHHSQSHEPLDPTALHPPAHTPRRTSIRDLATGAAPDSGDLADEPDTGEQRTPITAQAPASITAPEQPTAASTPGATPTRESISEARTRLSRDASDTSPHHQPAERGGRAEPSAPSAATVRSSDTAVMTPTRRAERGGHDDSATVTSTLEVCAEDFTAPRPVPEATSEHDRARRARRAKRAERERIALAARERIEARSEKAARERADRLADEDSLPELSEPTADGNASVLTENEHSPDDSQYYGMERGPGVLSERKSRESKRDKD